MKVFRENGGGGRNNAKGSEMAERRAGWGRKWGDVFRRLYTVYTQKRREDFGPTTVRMKDREHSKDLRNGKMIRDEDQ